MWTNPHKTDVLLTFNQGGVNGELSMLNSANSNFNCSDNSSSLTYKSDSTNLCLAKSGRAILVFPFFYPVFSKCLN